MNYWLLMLLLAGTLTGYGQVTLDDIIPVDSLQLMADVQLVDLHDQLLEQQDSLAMLLDTLQERVDSLRIRANTLAADHNFIVTKVNISGDRLVDQHFELRTMDRILNRHAGWLDRHYRKLTFVRYQTYYPQPRDKWASRVFRIGNLLFVARVGYSYWAADRFR